MTIDIDRMAALARHGAAAAPDAVLALIARLREAEAREQALAAHVERMRDAMLAASLGLGFALRLSHSRETTAMKAVSLEVGRLTQAARQAPDHFLARRDAEKQIEAMSEALDALEYMDREVGSDRGALDATRDELRARIRTYRRQAGQADTAGEAS